MERIRIPVGLLLGSATAATQIEGGDEGVNWFRWSRQGKVGNGESSITGAGHYERFREDVALMADLGYQCYRMSLEWSRIEPEEGRWDPEGVAHYREEISLLLSRGILPLVTLHHFSCPQWFQDRGGWLAGDGADLFLRFCRKAVGELGYLVSEWCTINEPNVFANDSYMEGKYPPGGKGDMRSYFRVSRHMVIAHIKAYRLIHRIRRERGFPGKTMAGYGAGDLANNLLFQMSLLYLLFYYTDVAGLSPGTVGVIFLIARIWDGINYPLMGLLVDRTDSPHGKGRVFLRYAALPLAAATVLLFSVPDMARGKSLYAGAAYIPWGMLYTMVSIPYASMTASMSGYPRERTGISSVRMLFMLAGVIIVAVGTEQAMEGPGEKRPPEGPHRGISHRGDRRIHKGDIDHLLRHL